MTILEAEHIFRAIREMTWRDDVLVVGSNAILGKFLDRHGGFEFWHSKEIDIAVKDADQEMADVLQNMFGKGSFFERTFAIMVNVVSDRANVMPDGWQRRLIRHWTPNGLLLKFISPEDLAFAKYVAWRGKDEEFLEELWNENLIDVWKMRELLPHLPEGVPEETKELVQARIERHYSQFCGTHEVRGS